MEVANVGSGGAGGFELSGRGYRGEVSGSGSALLGGNRVVDKA